MARKDFIPKEHIRTRSTFRAIGLISLFIGAICIIMAMVDFFTLDFFEEPKYFWLAFVGMPIVFIGLVFTSLGYGGKMARYQSREYAPIAKDTFNYLARETTPGVKEIANAVKQVEPNNTSINCHKCQKENDADARFCNDCGEKLVQVCATCQHDNPQNACFCNHCGNSLGEKQLT